MTYQCFELLARNHAYSQDVVECQSKSPRASPANSHLCGSSVKIEASKGHILR